MPTYLWRCEVCGRNQEVLRPVDKRETPPEEDCTNCNSDKWKRVITGGSGFVLQGNGWFKKGGY